MSNESKGKEKRRSTFESGSASRTSVNFATQAGARLVGDVLRRAATLGAGVYVTAEDAVNKTLNTVQIPPRLLRETIEDILENYSITVKAEIGFKNKRNKKSSESEFDQDFRTEEESGEE